MKYKLLRLLLLLSFTLSLTTQAQERTDEELLEIVRLAMEKRNKVKYKNKEAIKTFRTALKGLSDAERIRGICQIILYKDKISKYPMSSDVASDEYWAFSQDPHLITDYSELKRLIREEQDPRKFYLISCMQPRPTKENKHNFIPEHVHMLFKDGRVARYEGESTSPYNHDVSKLAYHNIFCILKAYDYHVTISGEFTHDQAVVILARWLKQNWPGCENLVIPDKFLKMNVPEVKEPVKHVKSKSPIQPHNEAPKEKEAKNSEKPQDPKESKSKPKEISQNSTEVKPNSNSNNKNSHIVWLVLGSLLSGLLISMWLIKRKS